MSALLPKADKAQTCSHVRFVPIATECAAANAALYSIHLVDAARTAPWDPISLVAISCSDNMSWKPKMAEPRGWGRQCGDAISSKRLPLARAQGDGGCVRAHRGGRRGVARCRQTPFAALPSMRNLAPDVRGGKHERSRRRDPDSEEPQTAGHRSPVRRRWVSGHPDRRSRTEGRRCLYR